MLLESYTEIQKKEKEKRKPKRRRNSYKHLNLDVHNCAYMQLHSPSRNHLIYNPRNAEIQIADSSEVNLESRSNLGKSKCLRCKLWFNDTSKLRAHYQISPPHHWCLFFKSLAVWMRLVELVLLLARHTIFIQFSWLAVAHAGRVLEFPFCTSI